MRCASSPASASRCWLGERRWVARGGRRGDVTEIATWMVPFGIVGGRDLPRDHLAAGRTSARAATRVSALYIWEGGLGIWGAITLGGVGAWIGCRRRGIPLPAFADALAPGIVLAQALGRLGNYFNQELFGRPDRPAVGGRDRPRVPSRRVRRPGDLPPDVPLRAAVERGGRGAGRSGRTGGSGSATGARSPSTSRPTPSAGSGSRRCASTRPTTCSACALNIWVSLLVLAGAVAYFVVSARRRPGRETPEELEARREPDQAQEVSA